ncbi:MAG TPA: cupin domain-containing protein [Steroidobacter sp.]|uniref:cupin domain-containing protein n=1 Tax=Steroidobacter sp. TaxID=1978227 RepID=UPI002ED854D7
MIVRRIDDVEKIDVGVPFGLPPETVMIQWIFSNSIGDERYHHKHAVRKYTLAPGIPLESTPFHHHKYVQSPYILKGSMIFENGAGEKCILGPGDSVIFHEDEPHRGAVLGSEPVELICIIDCPGGGEDCVADVPKNIGCG